MKRNKLWDTVLEWSDRDYDFYRLGLGYGFKLAVILTSALWVTGVIIVNENKNQQTLK